MLSFKLPSLVRLPVQVLLLFISMPLGGAERPKLLLCFSVVTERGGGVLDYLVQGLII